MSAVEFVPDKISINSRRGRRRGADEGAADENGAKNSGGGSSRGGSQHYSASQNSAISSSVVFHEDCELFDEIDELYPHEHEGGKEVADPHHTSSVSNTTYSRSDSNGNSSRRPRSDSTLSASRSLASSLLQSLQSSGLADRIPDYESLVASATSNDGTLAEMIAGIEERYKTSVTMSQASIQELGIGSNMASHLAQGSSSKRESIVGGRRIAEMSIEEQRELLAPERSSRSLTEENTNVVSSVDWSSLNKSCKRAKNAFRDADSGQTVVKNMFLTHLGALTTVLTSYARRYCNQHQDEGNKFTLDQVKAHVTETKRALRFAMSCLAPPRAEDESGEGAESESQDSVERYRLARRFRQELQEAAVKGIFAQTESPPSDGEAAPRSEPCLQYGLHIPLVEIVYSDRPLEMSEDDQTATKNGDKRVAAISAIERGKLAVRVLAARMLCNLVTDAPIAADMVLRDVPFAPSADHIEKRMAASVLGTKQADDNGVVFWSDLIAATAKVKAGDGGVDGNGKRDAQCQDREVLAAVAAALHNLLTSLEAQESLLELDDAMKRRENAKQRRQDSRSDSGEIEVELKQKGSDMGFEAASSAPLLSSLLRNILPSEAALTQSQLEREHMDVNRPKFKPPASAVQDMSDSATEWISLVLERLASRGLLLHMLRSAGTTRSEAVMPEQVVLVSCIRQAVDDYHSAITSTGETGDFGRRRLSIAAKTAGMAMSTRPHPLWGREDMAAGGKAIRGRDSRTAVPVLLSLANEIERLRRRANDLQESTSSEVYDGEQNCTARIIDDLCDILAQSLGRHAPSLISGTGNEKYKQCFLADARSVLGRESFLVQDCCKDLARILDGALARNSGRKAREMKLSADEQQTAIANVRLIGNLVYQCRYNQDLLRITAVPLPKVADVSDNGTSHPPTQRTGLHVILSATSLAPACFTLREWCIVAIRNAVENNDANAETVRRLEANQVVDDTPELQRIGVKVEMDAKGNVQVKKRD